DGYLYISTGDGSSPFPPDAKNTGQRIDDLLASILRIDVDHAENGLPYAIPKGNPFVGVEGARGEVWAYGFRNPWRMSFDPRAGGLWGGGDGRSVGGRCRLGNVGDDLPRGARRQLRLEPRRG